MEGVSLVSPLILRDALYSTLIFILFMIIELKACDGLASAVDLYSLPSDSGFPVVCSFRGPFWLATSDPWHVPRGLVVALSMSATNRGQ